jgi:hypothetical protein
VIRAQLPQGGGNGLEGLGPRIRKASWARTPNSPCRARAGARTARPTKKRRSSIFAVIAVGQLTRTCAPGAERAAEALRENTSSPQGLRNIEYEIWSTKRVREFVCAKRKGGEK